jgi:hypothetical protein
MLRAHRAGAGRERAGVTQELTGQGRRDRVAARRDDPGDLPHVFEALEPKTRAVLVSEHT